MNVEAKRIFRAALKRAKVDKHFDWSYMDKDKQLALFQTYVWIIIMEMEMNIHAVDFDIETIREIRKMKIDEWASTFIWVEKLPDPTDDFIVGKITERVEAGLCQ